jgi:ADP-ribose pyrophosphatase
MSAPEKKQKTPAAEILSRREIFKGFSRLEELQVRPRSLKHDGWAEPMSREIFFRRNVVSALLYIPETDEILLNQQFRLGAFLSGAEDSFLLECSAGAIDEGESAEDAARREAFEETGAEVLDIEFIGTCYPSAGGTAEDFKMYIARIAKPKTGIFGMEDEGEEIRTHLLPFAKVIELLDAGKITNATTALMLHWFARHHSRIRQKWKT